MHDKFEKEVQKKMEELNLAPSAPVWEKIELEIRPEKRRRRVIFWLFFGLLLLVGGFFTIELIKDKKGTTSSAQIIPPSSENKSTPVPSNSETNITTNKAEKTNSPTSKTENLESPTQQTDQTQTISKKANKTPSQFFTLQRNSVNKHSTEQTVINNHPAPIEKKIAEKKNDFPGETGPVIQPEKSPMVVQEKTIVEKNKVNLDEPIKVNDSLATPTETKRIELPVTVDSILKKKVASKKQWRKSVNLSIGKSDFVTASLLSFSPAANNANYYQSPVSTGAGVGSVVYRPSEIKSSYAFAGGFSFSKKINKRFELGLGLQYAYYSTTMNVGQRRRDTMVLTSVGAYQSGPTYSNGFNNQNNYTNRFHVIELPVSLSWQPVLQLPLHLSVGAAYGQLLSTNALTYSRTSNIYYESKESFTKHMLPVYTSLQVALFAKKKVSLRIGPSAQYNLLKVKKENTGETPHLFFAGIKSAIYF